MYYLVNMCFLCLKNKTYLNSLDEYHVENIVYKKVMDLVQGYVSNISYIFIIIKCNLLLFTITQDSDCLKSAKICERCIGFIKAAIYFENKCLVNSKMFFSYVNQLNTFSKVEGKVNVYLYDYYSYVNTNIKTEDTTDDSYDNIINSSEDVFYSMKITNDEGKCN